MAIRYARLAWAALTARGTFDGVETHVLFPTGLIGMIAARLRSIPHVVYVHGSDVAVTVSTLLAPSIADASSWRAPRRES